MNWNQNQYRPRLQYRDFMVTIILIAVNVMVFLVTMINKQLLAYLALTPGYVVYGNAWWQVATYMFVHDPYGIWHIFFNMFALFTFGYPLERRMGSLQFLLFYLVTGVGVGLITLLINFNTGLQGVPVIGASGAIYGLLLAYAAFYPDSRLYIFGIIPLRAPIAVLAFAGLELVFQFTGWMSGVAHLSHLAGLVIGFFYIWIRYRINALTVFFRR
jgi:membrane associated rhomboid family serine protease